MYLVDTNVVSEARRGTSQALAALCRSAQHSPERAHPQRNHARHCPQAEVRSEAAARLTEWLRKLRHDHGDRILPITDQIAVEWGRIAAIRPRGDIGGLIAATAIVHDLILVTRNVKEFEDTDASLINPCENWA